MGTMHRKTGSNNPIIDLEAQAMLALGRVDGALEHCSPATLRIFACRLIRYTLTSALQQEGHTFTEPRFDAWFAGLVTLSDDPVRHARPPRVLCETVLTELSHSPWEILSQLALQFQAAFLAPQDLYAEQSHNAAGGIAADGRLLVQDMLAHTQFPSHDPLPLAPLEAITNLHAKIRRSSRFAPAERTSIPMALGDRHIAIERNASASPRWAAEIHFGQCLVAHQALRFPLPCPSLISLEALATEEHDEARKLRAHNILAMASTYNRFLTQAAQAARRIGQKLPGQRGTSRAPAVFELLAGFGAMRSAQIETMIKATRLGVRGMLASLDTMGVITRTTVSGSHLYSAQSQETSPPSLKPARKVSIQDAFQFSAPTVDDFEESMAALDRLLTRQGSSVSEEE